MKLRLYCLLLIALPFSAKIQSGLQKVLNTLKTSSNTQAQNGRRATGGIMQVSFSPDNVKVGDIAPDAVYLDADRIFNFNGGAAIIQKGASAALLNAKGKLIVPYNTYSTISTITPGNANLAIGFDNGFYIPGFPSRNVMNGSGKIIISDYSSQGASVDHGKYIPSGPSHSGCSFYDINGKKYSPLKPSEFAQDVSEDIVLKVRPGRSMTEKSHYIYCKITGETISNGEFEEAYGFSDGMALVGKADQFGQIKYGYIDKFGSLAIPYKFSVKPGNFINGVAPVVPKDNSQFIYAFINKKGDIVLPVTNAYISKVGPANGFEQHTNVWNGWSILNCCYVMDSVAKVYTMQEFLNKRGIKSECAQMIIGSQTGSGSFLFLAQRQPNNMPVTNGALNLDKEFIITPIFENQLFFDPVSRLAYAKLVTDRSGGRAHYREGYINEYGAFVIVKKEQSQF